jgi:hypothetical protein
MRSINIKLEIIVFAFFLIIVLVGWLPQENKTSTDDFPILKDPCLGQKPPGDILELFPRDPFVQDCQFHSCPVLSADNLEVHWIDMKGGDVNVGKFFMNYENKRLTTHKKPSLFAELVSLDSFISPDGQRLHFNVDFRPKEKRMFAVRTNNGWSKEIDGLISKKDTHNQKKDHVKKWEEDINYLIKRLEITHPNLYANISKEEFLYFSDILKQKIPTSTDVEMVFGIQELIARIRNVHTQCTPIIFWDGKSNKKLKSQFEFYPIRFYPFEDGLYILSVAKEYEDILGKKVLKFGSMTAEETMNYLARFIPGDNYMAALANIPWWNLNNDGQLLHYIGASDFSDKIVLRLANDDGSEFDYEIKTKIDLPESFQKPFIIPDTNYPSMNLHCKDPVPLYLKDVTKTYWFEYLPENEAIYLQINSIWNNIELEPFNDFCKRMFHVLDEKKAKKLIIDLRLNTGGNHIELPLLKGIIARPHIDRHDRLFVIIGRVTVSAGQHLTSELEWYTNATFFGEPTQSKPNQYGAMRRYNLPNSKLEISASVDYYQDAQPFDFSMASEPDFYVLLTSSDFKANRDPVFESILSYDSYSHLRKEFLTVLSANYTKGGIALLKQSYHKIKKKYLQLGYNMEVLLYDDLDSWMFSNKKNEEDYIEFLKFIHNELPNSIVICHDLAFFMNQIGNTEEAKILYKKCLDLNPEHHYAKWRLGLIQLEEETKQ